MPNGKKAMNQSQREFIRGIAFAAAFIIRSHCEDSIALELIESVPLTYADLEKAKCDIFDLEPIAKIMKNKNSYTNRARKPL